jgi:hypothetical protein
LSNKTYIINSTATDIATNTESPPDSNTFYYDTDNPTTSISTPAASTWYNDVNTISGGCGDPGGSGVATVNITIYNSTGNTYWNFSSSAPGWAPGVNWSSTTLSGSPYNAWTFDSSSIDWINATTYIVNATATDNASNVDATPASTTYYIDTYAPVSSINNIPYWQTSSPITLQATVESPWDGSGLDYVTLYWYYSNDNSSFSGPYSFGANGTNLQWSFNFPNGSGYYRFYSVALDNASNAEAAPATNDTMCGYDTSNPVVTIVIPEDGGYNSSLNTINGTCSDTYSGINTVNITIYNATGNTYWNFSSSAPGWAPGVNWSSTTLSGSPYMRGHLIQVLLIGLTIHNTG